MGIVGNIEDLRAEFPALAFTKYLNSAAHGPALARVQERVAEWWNFYTYENTSMRAPDSKGEAAKALGVNRSDITWVNRVSQAVNIISGMVKFESGDNIVITDLGYPTGS